MNPTDEIGISEVPPCGCGTPGAAAPSVCYCGVEDLLRIIRRRYSLAVLNAIRQQEPAHYQQVARGVPKASSSTLTETLDALASARLIEKQQQTATSAQPLYSLTGSGRKLLSRLRRLLDDVAETG